MILIELLKFNLKALQKCFQFQINLVFYLNSDPTWVKKT